MVDTELRRSLRLKSQNTGFKPAGCGRKNCLGCDMDPPSLSTKVIRNLGEHFCKVAPELMSDEALKATKAKKRVIKPNSKAHVGEPVVKQVSTKVSLNGVKKKQDKV
jgi:hypothetical protein